MTNIAHLHPASTPSGTPSDAVSTVVLNLSDTLDHPLLPSLEAEGFTPWLRTSQLQMLHEALCYRRVELVLLYVDDRNALTEAIEAFLGSVGVTCLTIQALDGAEMLRLSASAHAPTPRTVCVLRDLGHILRPWLRGLRASATASVEVAA